MRTRLALWYASLGIAGFLAGSQLSFGPTLCPPQPETLSRAPGTNPKDTAPSQPPDIPHDAPTESESLTALNARIRRANASPADYRLQIMAAINALDSSHLEQMIVREIESDLFLRSQKFDFQYALSRLAELSPKKAAALWTAREDARMYCSELIAPWARKDPVAFANWTLAQSPEIQRAARETLKEAVTSDPALFVSFAHQLSASPNGPETARAAMLAVVATHPGSAQKQLEYASRLPEGAMRNAALGELAYASPGFDLHAHPEVLEALANLPIREAYELGRKLGKNADLLPSGPVREAAMAAALSAQAHADPAAAAKRLKSLDPNSPDYAPAVRGFVDSTSEKDPTAAAEWALTIPAAFASHRAAALERVAANFFRANPEGARHWVEGAPLSDDEYRRLTGRTRPMPRP